MFTRLNQQPTNMKKMIPGLMALIFCASCSNNTMAPVNNNASQEARELLRRIYEASGRKIFSGQHNYSHEPTRSSDTVRTWTGKMPVIWGSDFNKSVFRDNMIREAIRQHEMGSIITLMYHQGKPYPDSVGFLRHKMSQEEWKELLTPGTKTHRTWLADIDSVALHLAKLRDLGIPVLWRPYHEMNGGWFWWGQAVGEYGFIELWRMMYERYTNYHQLNNLIWVWNTNAPRDWQDDEAWDYAPFYPGHEYVDVLAADVYKADFKQSHHDQLIELGEGKPIALGEVGEVPGPEILDQQPGWAWFMIWARYVWTANSREDIEGIYGNPRVVSAEIPD